MEETDDDNFETFFADAPFLGSECSVEEEEEEGCGPPPPLWSLPPPPPPPWLSPAEADCSGAGGCSRLVAVDTQVQLQHTFHNLVIIAVCSALLVITLVFLTACIWRSVSLCPVSTRPINGGYFTKLGERRSLLLEETHPFRLG